VSCDPQDKQARVSVGGKPFQCCLTFVKRLKYKGYVPILDRAKKSGQEEMAVRNGLKNVTSVSNKEKSLITFPGNGGKVQNFLFCFFY